MTHRGKDAVHKGDAQQQKGGSWHEKQIGSGVFLNVGKTIAFKDHEDAVHYFLNCDKAKGPNGKTIPKPDKKKCLQHIRCVAGPRGGEKSCRNKQEGRLVSDGVDDDAAAWAFQGQLLNFAKSGHDAICKVDTYDPWAHGSSECLDSFPKNKPCLDVDGVTPRDNCLSMFQAMFAVASQAGYDTVQFTNHLDTRCSTSKVGATAVEIVNVRPKANSFYGCGTKNAKDAKDWYRTGFPSKKSGRFQPDLPCTCSGNHGPEKGLRYLRCERQSGKAEL